MKFPDIDPVAISIGPFPIRWYALAYLSGLLLGWWYALHITKLDKDGAVKKLDIDDFFPWAIAGVIVGGRMGYVLFYNLGMYFADPVEILRVWNGGMSFHGGAMGVIIAMILFAWKRKIYVLRLTDIVCAAVPIGLFFGRMANFINGELFGRITDSKWGMVFPHGGPLPRYPTQLMEAVLEGIVLAAILAVLVHMKGVRDRPGIVSGVFLCGYAVFRIFIEFFREPDRQVGYLWGAMTMGQVLCVPMMLGGLFLIGFALIKGRHDATGTHHQAAHRG